MLLKILGLMAIIMLFSHKGSLNNSNLSFNIGEEVDMIVI